MKSAKFSWSVFKNILQHFLLGYKNDEFASKMGLLLANKGSYAKNDESCLKIWIKSSLATFFASEKNIV